MDIDLSLLAKGVGVGLVFSAPVGAVNIMAIQRTFRAGFPAGVATGLGAVVADGLFAALAAYGFTAVANLIAGHARIVQLVGAALLIAFGWRIMTAHPHIEPRTDTPRTYLRSAGAAFGLTITNPATVLGYVAVFGTLGDLAPEPGDYIGATLLVLGVIAGAVLWWAFVCGTVAAFRRSINDHTLELINRGAGGVLITFGVLILLRLAWLVLGWPVP